MKKGGWMGVNPYPRGRSSKTEQIEAGLAREEITAGQTKAEAIRLGRALQKRMNGTGWRLRVWQNLGWHYSVRRGPLSVYPTSWSRPSSRVYYATLSDSLDGFGDSVNWSNHRHYRDPNRAVNAAIKMARAYLAQAKAAVDAAERSGLT